MAAADPRHTLAAVARGRWGEDRAAQHYRRAGFQIVDRNWRCGDGEIDLIARRGDLVVICETKARRTDRFGPATSAVGVRKQQRLRGLAARWLRETGTSGVTVRFDVAAVTGVELEIIAGAF
ncbi:YraN family protein [soil metagenome]